MKNIDKRLILIATGAYMLFIAYMSVIRLNAPGETPSLSKQTFHNLLHIPAYGVLTFLLINCFKGFSTKALAFSGLIALGYGLLMEYFQSLTGYRSAQFMDVCFNAFGVACVVLFYFKRTIKTS